MVEICKMRSFFILNQNMRNRNCIGLVLCQEALFVLSRFFAKAVRRKYSLVLFCREQFLEMYDSVMTAKIENYQNYKNVKKVFLVVSYR